MTSRFVGRDYSSLRSEIIDFLRKRLPQSWDYTNLADPVVIFAESMARVGDQLHYTIDEVRRECDVATARRASSIYSYAMREGYKMMLPKGANGTISVNCTPEQSDRMKLSLKQFDEIKVGTSGLSLFVSTEDDDITGYAVSAAIHESPDPEYLAALSEHGIVDYAAYANDIYSRTLRFGVVLGKKETFNFTYNDINSDSTVTLPNPIIDRDLIRLTVRDDRHDDIANNTKMKYVEDIIASGFVGDIYTLTPKFIGGAITLNIEFPTDYKTMFTPNATFSFQYIKIQNTVINPEENINISLADYITAADPDDVGIDPTTYIEINDQHTGSVIVDLNNGIKGYREYEDSTTTRENYKNFIQDYSALLTKNDYANYVKIATNSYCKVYDHSDNYKENVLPPNTELIPRIVYILTDAPYTERERLWNDLIERSSRSDVIMLMPYGKDPYTIIVRAECFLMGTSISTISTQIKSELLQYYSDSIGAKIPEVSMINYLTHKASDKVIRMDSVVVRDTTFGATDSDGNYIINQDFADASKLSNDDVDLLFNAIKNGNPNINVNNNPYRLTGLDADGNVYTKYPVITYKPFPDEFPKIYLDDDDTTPLTEYDDIVKYQVSYGRFDREAYDIKDCDLFEDRRVVIDESIHIDTSEYEIPPVVAGGFLTESFTVENPSNAGSYTKAINSHYIKHHYMVPVLNRVIVLVKAIGN